MNKELEALEKLANNALTDEERKLYKDIIEVNLEMYEELKNKAMQTELELGEKETILNIIIKKEVNIGLLKGILHSDLHTHTASYYNSYFVANYRHLTQGEYNLLKKEVLKYGKL